MSAKKTIMVVGLTGSGKSTTSNSIINKSGELKNLNAPFKTSDGSAGCTLTFQTNSIDDITVLDTVGFGDPQFTPSEIFDEFKKALEICGNKITHVIFVVKKERFSNEVVQFLETIQEKVLKEKCSDNSLVLFTNAEKGWVQNQNDKFIQKAVDNCNGRYYEYSLRFDRQDDDQDDKKRNIQRRQKAVDEFLSYLNNLNFREVDLSYVQSAQFEQDYNNEIVPAMLELMNDMFGKVKNETVQNNHQFDLQKAKELVMRLNRQNEESAREMEKVKMKMNKTTGGGEHESLDDLKNKIQFLQASIQNRTRYIEEFNKNPIAFIASSAFKALVYEADKALKCMIL